MFDSMKRVFTLVELLIVVVIIWIILWALSFLSWRYILRLKMQTDIRNFENLYSSVYGQTLWYFSKNYSKTWYIVIQSGDNCVFYYIQSGVDSILKKKLCFWLSKIKSLKINNTQINSWELIFNSFNIWVKLKDNFWNLYTGWILDIILTSPAKDKKMKVMLEIGRLFIK